MPWKVSLFVALLYLRGLKTFSARGHIDDLRLGKPNMQKNLIYPKYGELIRGYLFLSYDAKQHCMFFTTVRYMKLISL